MRHHGLGSSPISISPVLSNLQRRHLRPGIQSDLRSPSSISNLQRRHLRPDQISDLNLQSPISNLDSGARGRRGAQTFKEMQFGFIHTDHLSSPISNLLLGHCRRRQQSTTSIFNLRSHIWGGSWLGARIYNLHSPSPISTFWPVLLLSDLQSTISIFDL